MSRRVWNYRDVAAIATAAWDADMPMYRAVSEHYEVTLEAAGLAIWKARNRGFNVPVGKRGPGLSAPTRVKRPEPREFDLSWQDDGACRGVDPDLFFPERGNPQAVTKAKAVCRDCPVRTECGEYALDAGEIHGIWGGMSERERRRIRRTRRLPVVAA